MSLFLHDMFSLGYTRIKPSQMKVPTMTLLSSWTSLSPTSWQDFITLFIFHSLC